jgi:hypothetical protein
MGERNQVAAWDFVDGLAEPLVCHACLKVAQKEPIVFTNHHVNRNVGPRLEVRGLAEGDLGFPALVRGSFLATSFGTSWRKYVARSNSTL